MRSQSGTLIIINVYQNKPIRTQARYILTTHAHSKTNMVDSKANPIDNTYGSFLKDNDIRKRSLCFWCSELVAFFKFCIVVAAVAILIQQSGDMPAQSKPKQSKRKSADAGDAAKPKPKRIKLGGAFDGLGTPAIALEIALSSLKGEKPAVDYLFASESDAQTRAVLAHNHKIKRIYKDVAATTFDDCVTSSRLPMVTLYAAGPPCAPFAKGGRRRGEQEERGEGRLIWNSIGYIAEKHPDCFIIEESDTLMDTRFKPFLKKALIYVYIYIYIHICVKIYVHSIFRMHIQLQVL